MPSSLRPCPACGRVMESNREVCVYCDQVGDDRTIQATSEPQPTRGGWGWVWKVLLAIALICGGFLFWAWAHFQGVLDSIKGP